MLPRNAEVRAARPATLRWISPLSMVAVILCWYVLSRTGFIGQTLLASPGEVWHTIAKAFAPDSPMSAKFYIHAWHTICRAASGWAFAISFGVIAGIILGSALPVYEGGEPVVEFFRAIPPVLAFPLLLVAFNYGEGAYTWTIVFGCFPVMTLTVARGKLAVSPDRLEILRSFGVGQGVRLFATAMEIVPSVFLGARITLSIAIIIAVVSEMVFTPRSGYALGALARDSEVEFNTPMFYTCVLTIGAFGYAANWLMRKIEQWFGFRVHRSDVAAG